MTSPVKPTFKTEVLPLSLIALSVVASFYFYANFPDQVPIHWNYQGEIDDYASKEFGAFFFPALILGIYLMFLFIPFLDPKKERYQDFRKAYHVFKAAIIIFMVLIYGYTGLAGLGYDIPIATVIPSAVGILCIIIGNYLGKIKTNWFMGIRTPWTLSNDEVWNKTNRLGGKMFIVMGLIMVFAPLLQMNSEIFWWIFIVSIAVVAIIPIVYSYILYRKIEKNTSNQPKNDQP
ncbi:MAG: hypothetical protein A2744_03545 [Candidatus Buchananbacteria bacterium RIFCSPHIGHO2_01_FULL_44_11]|uniref:DUF1648 domain-containing protein n=1 Tax=Candidatus Buchananbacteria bacterium RIFCSPHIGHO2_01_FULL_44_11 TaxID=1797535 RepID=A0A1G1Y2T4_9BACT|nr:MAG: hypothetical protein A2744_03545 [Candidatus Buchananbacteria bacterium RIFCSPHIGHO2_01_FULL_44_11]